MKDQRERTALLDQATETETERTVLGAMMLEPAALAEGCDRLYPDDFYLDSHQRIFRALANLRRQGTPVDYFSVKIELESRAELDAVGGFGYLINLDSEVPRNLNIGYYVQVLRDKARTRRTLALLYDGYNSGTIRDVQSFIEGIGRELQQIAQDDASMEIPSVGEFLAGQGPPEQLYQQLTTTRGIPLGFTQLDEATLGAQPGELWIVAGRPSMGKTAWVDNVAADSSLRGYKTALFTIEQSKLANIRRMLASRARIPLKLIRKGELRREDRMALATQRDALSKAPLFIDDTRRDMTVTRIRAKCAHLKRTEGLDLVLVDQLSHVRMTDCKERDYRLRVGEQTKGFKDMSMELGVPVIVLNQITRGDKKASDHTPRLSDLKESGNIEEDADVAVLLHRPEYYDKSDPALKGKGDMILAKNREGETRTCHCRFDGAIVRWEDEEQPAPAEQESFYRADPNW